ncbi:hypothetical protein CSB45_11120 [candidate division KSB3 bacterium]|uniref:Uncharacterized protein n=1 Tax=candidate division KSB3 bacterium TaxID=2044937 RepID=A0A2G6E3L7_9BACT|nr:MAG: hypothetical protein CSB45_11120 [candidate division KSB3 bacterium]PIE29041.1 MAG: hypothetical protein CSA57_10485 [candidate division KSB3 bacterium]
MVDEIFSPQHSDKDLEYDQEGRDALFEKENESAHDESSEIMKKYLNCIKHPSGRKRRRCISRELG